MEPISIVILVHNEARIIERVIRDFHQKIISKIPGSEFIVAEDGSNDGTKEILERLSKELPIRLFSDDRRKGYSKAMYDAFSLARNNIVLFSDSDGQHDPDDFWKLAEEIENYDLITGWKFERKDPKYRIFFSKMFNLYIRVLFKIKLRDVNCGFKLIKKKIIDDLVKEKWILDVCGSSEFTIRAFKKGYSIGETSIRHYERKFGESRGFPARNIPKQIFQALKGFWDLKAELSKAEKKT